MTDIADPFSPPEIIEIPVSPWREAGRRFFQNRLSVTGLVVVTLFVLIVILGPFVLPYSFMEQDLTARNALPSMAHWLGTDDLGRDLLARVIYGGRTALFIAVIVTVLSAAIGILAGAIAGFRGGWIDAVIMWLTDMTMSIPTLLLVVVINASLQPLLRGWMDAMFLSTKNTAFRDTTYVDLILVFGTIALVKWPQYARLMRGQVLTIRTGNYVLAARALGLSPAAVLARYIVPNAIGPIIVAASFGLGTAMVLESSFSFLGVGVQPPIPSWGRMIADGLRAWSTHPHLLTIPALVLAAVTVSFSFVGDGLNEALNPKTEQV